LIDRRNLSLKRLSVLTIQFYKVLLLYNIAFTIVAQVLVLSGGIKIGALSFLVAKLMGFAFAVGLHYFISKDEYFYFRNAGYSMRWIILSAATVDVLFCLMTTLLSILTANA
jgi:hypothetical protein